MAGNQFSVSLNCFTWGRFDVAECLEQIKKTPIRMVELPVEQKRPNSLIPELMVDAPDAELGWKYNIAELKKLLARDGFRAESIDVFGPLAYPGGTEIVKRRIDFARALGAETIVLGCGHLAFAEPEDPASAEKVRAYIYAMLREAGAYAAQKGVRIALEIHHGIAENAEQAMRTLREVNCPNVGINFDTANILFYNDLLDSAGAARELEILKKHVFHVHLKDFIRGRTRREHVLPRLGTGQVDFPGVFKILHSAGFYGPFSFEVETFHRATESDSIADYQNDLTASIEYIKSLGEFDTVAPFA